MRRKLGLQTEEGDDESLLAELLGILEADQVDYAIFFRALCHLKLASPASAEAVRDLVLRRDRLDAWLDRYHLRLAHEATDEPGRQEQMKRANPKYVLRSYLAERAIRLATEQRDFSEIETLRVLLRNPYDEHAAFEAYAGPPPDWGKHLVLSCSS